MTLIFAVCIALFLAYANGANDNFKGVATLFGSGTTDYRRALLWGTVTTAAGSLLALLFARGLLAAFSGKGLVPDAVTTMKSFQMAVVFAAAATVMLATRFGFPISTTHALTGALVGAGLLASSSGVNYAKLGTSFFAPLLVSPLLAIVLAMVVYPLFHFARVRLKISRESCVCVGCETADAVPVGATPGDALAMTAVRTFPTMAVGNRTSCQERYNGQLLGVNASTVLDGLHYLSGGIVSFARGLNDTPKIAAILLVGSAISPAAAITGVALFMAVGGLLNARKTAETMAHRVTAMNAGQGLTANLVTGFLVIFASKLGLPVSTTHVSCGSLFGIGTVTRQARWQTIAGILAAWVTTLPVAALLGAVIFLLLRRMIG
ncbi:inorganic phosphate transporter [Geobacter argillaceus]|uniref:Phosphate transporter n=1 Tax=Geobacter argillaceus TaxID=345631 RepID=A0A562V675_9BACT|nr:inorganic phosphate transporter [Geobacter argillaceus]TWJ13414.1 PiT family inorganic phosphate transporter [Geobacter argillaceus]